MGRVRAHSVRQNSYSLVSKYLDAERARCMSIFSKKYALPTLHCENHEEKFFSQDADFSKNF